MTYYLKSWQSPANKPSEPKLIKFYYMVAWLVYDSTFRQSYMKGLIVQRVFGSNLFETCPNRIFTESAPIPIQSSIGNVLRIKIKMSPPRAIFTELADWVDSVSKSQCLSVVCVFVCPLHSHFFWRSPSVGQYL